MPMMPAIPSIPIRYLILKFTNKECEKYSITSVCEMIGSLYAVHWPLVLA